MYEKKNYLGVSQKIKKTLMVAILLILASISVFGAKSQTYGEDWEGKKILIDERDAVISACEKGILSRGFPYDKVKKYCKCSVDYMTEIAIKYNKKQLKRMAKNKGKNFLEKEAVQECKSLLE